MNQVTHETWASEQANKQHEIILKFFGMARGPNAYERPTNVSGGTVLGDFGPLQESNAIEIIHVMISTMDELHFAIFAVWIHGISLGFNQQLRVINNGNQLIVITITI